MYALSDGTFCIELEKLKKKYSDAIYIHTQKIQRYGFLIL